MRLGQDDAAIAMRAMNNRLSLEEDDYCCQSLYVISTEVEKKGLALESQKPRMETHVIPIDVVEANSMIEAINHFESTSFKRQWVPASDDPQEAQIGISKTASRTAGSIVRINRVTRGQTT